MQIPVVIEPVAGNGFRARGCEPYALTAEGPTREEALHKLQELLHDRLPADAQIVPLELAAPEHPLARFAGMYPPDDPLVQDWLRIMAENRRQADEDAEVL